MNDKCNTNCLISEKGEYSVKTKYTQEYITLLKATI